MGVKLCSIIVLLGAGIKIRGVTNKIQQDRPQLEREKFEGDAEGHHITRKKDDPSKALVLSNIVVVKSQTHDTIHKAEANSPETLKELAKEKGWNEENIK